MPPTMYPIELPNEIISDPKRKAEIQVFNTLRDEHGLNERWRVFYSLDWIGEYGGYTRDGEADFVIAHPDVGFLVLEVKGGSVTVKPGPKWESIDRYGEKHTIENGMRQAMKSKKVIQRALIKTWGENPPFFRGRHGVVLPHCSEPDSKFGDLAQGMPRELFVFKGQMGRLGLRVRELLNWNAFGADDKIGMGGMAGIALLEQLYGRTIKLSSRLKDEIKDVENRILELSEDQKRVLRLVKKHKNCLIRGAAGTGKTIIAKERALLDLEAGSSVLFLCYNQLLQTKINADLRSGLSSEQGNNLAVYTFHGLCTAVTRRQKQDGESDDDYYNQILPSLLYNQMIESDLCSSELPLKFDRLIIDECQDFSDGWLEILLDLAELNNADVSVFQDNNQCIYRDNKIADLLDVQPISLSENFRNSKEIFDVVKTYVDDAEFESRGPAGPSVRCIEVDSSALESVLTKVLDTLVETEGVTSEDIVMLTGSSLNAHANFDNTASIQRYSIWRFKGLESPVVVLTDLRNAIKKPELAYVGVSRARSLLILVDSADNLNCLLSVLPAELRRSAERDSSN